VFLTETLPAIATAFPDHPGFEAIATNAEHERGAAHDRVRAAVATPTHTGCCSTWARSWPHNPGVQPLDVDALALEALSIESFAAMLLEAAVETRAARGQESQ